MTVDRRFVIKGMALGSFAGLTMGRSMPAFAEMSTVPFASGVSEPLLALVNEGAAGAVFLQGAAAGGGLRLQAHEVGRELSFMLDFDRQLRGGPSMRVIGLLDNASATLIVDLARGAGARVQWLGQHSVNAGPTRHRLLDTANADGCSRRLREHLEACPAGFQMTEERQGSAARGRQWNAPSRGGKASAEWASRLGYLLASLDTAPAMTAPDAPSNVVLNGSFVSFSIET